MPGRSVIILFFSLAPMLLVSQDKLDFQQVEDTTYGLYLQSKWDLLIKTGEEAIDQGIDYYYLRMRLGIAYFEKEKYLRAIPHFKRAGELNTLEHLPAEYLYYCYRYTLKEGLASSTYRSLPEKAQARIDSSLSQRPVQLHLETGPLLYSAEKQVKNQEKGGDDVIYYEAIYPINGWYSSGFFSWNGPVANPFLAYTNVAVDKKHLVKVSDTIFLDDRFSTKQNQVYLQVPFHPGKGWKISPAAHWITFNFTDQVVSYEETEETYVVDKINVNSNDYIFHLEIEKDFGLFVPYVFSSYGTLNESEQFQAGGGLITYPSGNLNFYTVTALLDHYDENKHSLVFEQSLGFRISRKLWSEAYVTLGEVTNYYNRKGYIVYNTAYPISLISGLRLQWFVGERVELGLEYKLNRQEGYDYGYSGNTVNDEFIVTQSRQNYFFLTHLILGGISWKL